MGVVTSYLKWKSSAILRSFSLNDVGTYELNNISLCQLIPGELKSLPRNSLTVGWRFLISLMVSCISCKTVIGEFGG